MRSVGVLSLGCKVNAYESEFVINKLKENGYLINNFNDICDVYIINTCKERQNLHVRCENSECYFPNLHVTYANLGS